jgi:hypothetical protein
VSAKCPVFADEILRLSRFRLVIGFLLPALVQSDTPGLAVSRSHAEADGMVCQVVGFAIALAADVSDGKLQGVG